MCTFLESTHRDGSIFIQFCTVCCEKKRYWVYTAGALRSLTIYQGYRNWYQSEVRMRIPFNDSVHGSPRQNFAQTYGKITVMAL